MVRFLYFSRRGTLIIATTLNYDVNGNLTEVDYHDPVRRQDSKLIYENDEFGNWIRETELILVTQGGQTYWERTGKEEYQSVEYYP